jgi:hypothetical membrane protein
MPWKSARAALVAAVVWIVAGVGWLVGEAVTASAFPGYSYATNYISDLGVPEVAVFQGRAIDSPLSLVMNVTFVGQGVLFLLAGILIFRAVGAGARKTFLVLAAIHAVGIALVGFVHGSEANLTSGLVVFHFIGAALAIIAANTALIVAGVSSRGLGAPRVYRLASVALGAIGILSLVMLEIDSSTTAINVFPDGVWERAAVYTVIAWELMTGFTLLGAAARRRRGAGARVARVAG